MARVAAVIADLLFGSNAKALLERAGHDVTLAREPSGDAELVVADLTTGADPVALVAALPAGARSLGVYAHVEPAVRDRALAAGFDMVVPRSRFMREGGELVARLLSDRG